MSISSRLLGLKALQLRHAAFLLGLSTTGTKAELSSALTTHLRLSTPPVSEPNRIVSIDMGIKNLGICVLETMPSEDPSRSIAKQPQQIKILDWKRENLLSHPLLQSHLPNPDPGSTTKPPSPSTPQYSPSIFSPLATHLTTSLLSTYAPHTILIERQRFRSGSASAVQEWTLRVNMLESMLWASLETLRTHFTTTRIPGWERFPQAFEVLPARVAQFWCNPPEGFGTRVESDLFEEGGMKAEKATNTSLKAKGKKSTIDKKQKIALVQSWLSSSSSSTAMNPNKQQISLTLSPAAHNVADAFPQRAGKGKKQGDVPVHGKLDDYADCLLQGVAWCRWRENEEVMREMLRGSGVGFD